MKVQHNHFLNRIHIFGFISAIFFFIDLFICKQLFYFDLSFVILKVISTFNSFINYV